jgi:hypothetical protein
MAVYNQQTHYDLSVLWAMDGPRHLIGRHSNHLLGPLRISPVPAGKDAFRVAAFDAQAALGYPVVCYYGLEVGPNVEFKIDGAVHLAFVAIIRAEHFARPPALALVGMHGPIAPIEANLDESKSARRARRRQPAPVFAGLRGYISGDSGKGKGETGRPRPKGVIFIGLGPGALISYWNNVIVS